MHQPAATDRSQLEKALPRVATLLGETALGACGDLAVERQFHAGQSNPTYLLQTAGRRLVLRKQPYGTLLPKAHDVLREHAIITQLHAAGFPVPRPLLAVQDREVIGTAFFVMEFVGGNVESDPILPSHKKDERQAIYRNIAETMADLHRVDPSVLQGANMWPRPDFLGRQVNIWATQYAAAQTETDDRVELIAGWLVENRPPESNPTIVHGDFRIENLILQEGRVAAVLDWELCAIGDPLCDLSYCCIWYHLPREVLGGLSDIAVVDFGIPDKRQFIDIYSRRSGTDGSCFHNYYMSFSFYRLAAILQGVYKRGLDGNASSPEALGRGAMARLCLDQAERFAQS